MAGLLLAALIKAQVFQFAESCAFDYLRCCKSVILQNGKMVYLFYQRRKVSCHLVRRSPVAIQLNLSLKHDQQISSRIVIDQVIQFGTLMQIICKSIFLLRTVDDDDTAVSHPNKHPVFFHIIEHMIKIYVHSPFARQIRLLTYLVPNLSAVSIKAMQNRSIRVNAFRDGSPSRILSVRLISLGITTRPNSSIRLTMPVALNAPAPP